MRPATGCLDLAHDVRRPLTVDVGNDDRFAAVAQVALEPEWQAGSLRLVAFLQERKSRRVLGVTQLRIE